MTDDPQPRPSFRRRAAIWAPALAGVLLAAYLVIHQMAAQSTWPSGCQAAIAQLRALAADDPAALAEKLSQSASLVPAGQFQMGSNTGRDDERPEHAVYLDAFEMDCFETTNAQFALFLAATGGEPPPYWPGPDYPAGQADYPVVGVPWSDADAYCRWAGKRLPTEAEWEKAARGLDGRTYPWGNDWDPARANVFLAYAPSPAASPEAAWDQAWGFLRAAPTQPGLPSLRPVGSYPQGQSPFGIMDMAGNASEWVADWYNWRDYADMPTRNPVGLGPPWNHVIRGSAWYDPAGNAAWAQAMSRAAARSSSHDTRDPRVGFRCARSIQL